MKKKVLLIAAAVIILFIAVSAIFIFRSAEKASIEARNIQVQDVDLSSIEDGIYLGEYSFNGLVKVEVEVSVKNNAISDINLIKHDNGRGKNAEAIPQEVIKAQSLNVDTVTGATVSSKVILKAIEDALTKK